MSRKRERTYPSRHHVPPRSSFKRRRPFVQQPPPPPIDEDVPDDKPIAKPPPPPAILVMGLSPDCSVLDLKSRFEIYGSISRIRIDRDGIGCISYRTKDSGEAAIAASLDPSFGITVDSKKVQVLWETDPLAKWSEGVGANRVNKTNTTSSSSSSSSSPSSSKLLRAEVPLSKLGRGNKLASAIVNPRSISNGESSKVEVPFNGREIVAYDDIL